MDWPVVRGDYTVYNRDSSAAVVFIGNQDWEVPELKDKIAISGKLLTPQGAERVILNTISNPRIRDFFVVGEDVEPFFPKDALLALYENGMDPEKKIRKTKAKINKLPNLRQKFLEEFQTQVENIYQVDSREELEGLLEDYGQKEAHRSRLDFDQENFSIEPSTPSIPCAKSGYYLEGGNLEEAWIKTLKAVWNCGKEIRSQEGLTKEILNLAVHIRSPLQPKVEDYPLGKEELENYAESLVHPKLGEKAEYLYGLRLRVRGDQILDQVEQVVQRLRKSPNTRRAVAVLWIPGVDGKKESGQPCLISVDFKVRDGKLHLSGIMRSNDLYGAVPSNWYGLAKLNEHVAQEIGAEPGTITTLSHSAHIYATDYSSVKQIVEKEKLLEGYLKDELGYFLVEVDRKEGKIKVNFFDSEGKLNKEFEGENATDLRKRIINNEIVSLKEHAAYLGEQLAKAEHALNHDLEFDQDGA